MTGSAWWAERWLKPIIESRDLRSKVRRGRVVAQRGRVEGVTVRPGLVSADVRSDTGLAYGVKIRKDVIAADVWGGALDRMAEQAGFAATLLGGRLSEEMVDVFEEAGADLFPHDYRDLVNFCTCNEDDAPLCTHAVAAHFSFADAIHADPFALFEFRGRSRKQLMEALRERRGASLGSAEPTEPAAAEEEAGTDDLAQGYYARGVIPRLAFRVTLGALDEEESFPVVRALGTAPGEIEPEVVARVLAPLFPLALQRVAEIADRAPDDEVEAPDVTRATTLDDVLVAAAHQHGGLTSSFVADALGVSTNEARQYLRWLVEEGRLTVRGRARGTRYVPAE